MIRQDHLSRRALNLQDREGYPCLEVYCLGFNERYPLFTVRLETVSNSRSRFRATNKARV